MVTTVFLSVVGLWSGENLNYSQLYVRRSTYTAGIDLTQNFELKILRSTNMLDRFIHSNLEYIKEFRVTLLLQKCHSQFYSNSLGKDMNPS